MVTEKNNIIFCAFFFQLEKKVVTVGEGEHPLQCPHAFWFSRRPQGKPQASNNYADNIKLVGKFASVSFSLNRSLDCLILIIRRV